MKLSERNISSMLAAVAESSSTSNTRIVPSEVDGIAPSSLVLTTITSLVNNQLTLPHKRPLTGSTHAVPAGRLNGRTTADWHLRNTASLNSTLSGYRHDI